MDQNGCSNNASRGHAVFDSVRGGLERLDRSSTQEGRTNEGNISFQPDGFNVTLRTQRLMTVTLRWRGTAAAGGTAVNNGDGSTARQRSKRKS